MLKDEALKYCKAGWPVLPLVPGTKNPIVKWTEFQERNATEIEVAAWWDRWPNANIGAVTGRNFVVVDVDTNKCDAPMVAKAIWERFPTELIGQSARGGFHLYYSLPEDENESVGNRVSAQAGVDFRGHGGIIALPPSVFEGKQYKWIRTGEVGPFPTGLFADGPESGNENRPKWVTEALEGVGEGERNDMCAHLAGYFLGKDIPADIVQALLIDWNRKNRPPMPDAEIATTVASVSRKMLRKVRKTPQSAISLSPEQRVFNTIPIDQFLREYGTRAQQWLIEDWLPDESIIMVVAPPGSYKTWLTYDLAISLCTRTNFLGCFPVNKQCRVLIAQQEDSLSGWASRLAEVICAKMNVELPAMTSEGELQYSTPPSLDIQIHPYRMLRFEDELIMQDFERKIASQRPDVVILDPLYSLAATDDYMMKIAEHMMKLKFLRDKYRCSFVLVHHSKKNAKENEREAAWGSQFVNAAREGGWHITKPDEAEPIVNITRFFKDGEGHGPLKVEFNIQTKTTPTVYEVYVGESVPNLEGIPSIEGQITSSIA